MSSLKNDGKAPQSYYKCGQDIESSEKKLTSLLNMHTHTHTHVNTDMHTHSIKTRVMIKH